MSLPTFTYHPDPLATGSIQRGNAICVCCGVARGYVYKGAIYGPGSHRACICPWCIADGSAAKKLEAMFSDDNPLAEAGVPEDVIEEVTRRTPGYNSWQQEAWLSCCDDACEFHGDAPRAELEALQGDALAQTLTAWTMRSRDWEKLVDHYQPGGNPSVYKFRCRHCGGIQYAIDFT